MRGTPTKTPERVAYALRRLSEGAMQREVAEELGVSRSTINAWVTDPDGARQKARRARYCGTCRDCGHPTDGSAGRAGAPVRCRACSNERATALAQQRIITAIQDWAAEHNGTPPATTDWSPALATMLGHHVRAQKYRDANGRWPATSTVVWVFGSWRAAMQVAGFEPRRPGRPPLDPAVAAETIRLYRTKLSCAQIGALQGISQHTVRKRLIAAGEPLRSPRVVMSAAEQNSA